jgi:hypothetical protein
MALNVLGDGGAIHPVVGSIFSAPMPGVSVATPGDEWSVRSADRTEIRREAAAPAPIGSPTVVGRGDAVAAAGDLRAARSSAASPIADGPSSMRPGSVGAASRVAAQPFDDSDRPAAPSAQAHEADTIFAPRDHPPLIAVPLAPRPAEPAFARPTQSRAEAAQQVGAHSRASDEIEIHIGRVEIAAVHPAPARTAPAKPTSRAASLDDYLKRRDGRS